MALFKIVSQRMSPSNLEYFAAIPDSVDAGAIAAPSPVNGQNIIARKVPKPIKGAGIIDVYRTFDWTASPINNANFNSITKTPYAVLTEYRMDDLSVINSMLYYIQAGADQISAALNTVGTAATLGTQTPDVSKFIENLTGTVKDKVLGALGTNVQQQNKKETSGWIKPYDGLYSLQPTKFEYYLPYFENDAFNNVNSTYADTTFPGVTQVSNARAATTEFSRIISPGQYIESPKLFSLSDANAQRIDIKFPLLNTLSFESAVRNYQLLWLLVFQNTPQRVTKSVVEMPRMYDVHIPGVTFMKFAYIESMKVDFIGVRRRVTIPMPQCPGNEPQAEVIMPDAYQVTISLKSAIMNANNMMLENWRLSTPQA